MVEAKDKIEKSKFDFQRIAEYNVDQMDNFLIYGAQGTGKTFLLGSGGSRTLIVDTGRGTATLSSKQFKEMYPDSNPMVISVKESKLYKDGSLDKGVAGFKGWDLLCDVIDDALKYHSSDFDILGVDEFSAVSKMARYRGMEMNKVNRNIDTIGKAKANKMIPVAEVSDYQAEMALLSWFMTTYNPIFSEHRKYFVALAHEATIYGKASSLGEMAKPILRYPALTGQKDFAPNVFPSYFGDVWRMTVEGRMPNAKFVALTGQSETYIAKSRNGGTVQGKEYNPNLREIITRIEKYKKSLVTKHTGV